MDGSLPLKLFSTFPDKVWLLRSFCLVGGPSLLRSMRVVFVLVSVAAGAGVLLVSAGVLVPVVSLDSAEVLIVDGDSVYIF